MPNWCMNALTLSGDEKQIKAFFDGFDYENDERFISTYYPIPSELQQTIARYRKHENKVTLRTKPDDDDGWDEGMELSEEEAKEFIERNGGYNSWYDWCVDHWDTKWHDCYGEFDGQTYHFETAWSPPNKAVLQISKMFPDVVFYMTYIEDGMGFEGTFECQNGEVISDWTEELGDEYYEQFEEE